MPHPEIGGFFPTTKEVFLKSAQRISHNSVADAPQVVIEQIGSDDFGVVKRSVRECAAYALATAA